MKKTLIIAIPTVIVLGLVGYLFGFATMQANDYKTTARTNHLAVSTSAAKAISAASQNAFYDQDISIAEAKNAIKISKDAASDLAVKIESNEAGLGDFDELPLVATVNPSYKATTELASLETQYVAAAKSYLAEFQAVNKYNEQTLPVLEMSEQLMTISAKLEVAASEAELTAGLDEVISKLNEITKTLTAIKAPESVNEMHAFTLKSIADLTTIMKQTKAAMQAMDMEALDALSAQADAKQANMDKESKKITLKLIEQSKLAKLGDKLNDFNKQIDIKVAKL